MRGNSLPQDSSLSHTFTLTLPSPIKGEGISCKTERPCVKKKTPPTTSNPPKTASHGNTRPRKRRTKANLKPPTPKISNTPKVQKDTRTYQDRRTYHLARAAKKRARVIRLSLRGAQRRGNLVEVEHVPGNHHCYGDEIATLRSQ